MNPKDYPHSDITEKIIGAAIAVHRALGPGYLESIYENALKHELQKRGLRAEQQKTFPVLYDGVKVGEHRLDLMVEDAVLVELKAVDEMTELFRAQVISSLKAAQLKVGLLINFNEVILKNGIKRIILSDEGKNQAS